MGNGESAAGLAITETKINKKQKLLNQISISNKCSPAIEHFNNFFLTIINPPTLHYLHSTSRKLNPDTYI
jgi:hypothetical protein